MTTPQGSTQTEEAKRQPGCLGNIFLDITGLGFLVQIKQKLGSLGFALAFSAVMLFMFVLGARVERYAHLGEHQYVLQLLPMASCFSPLLALLMTVAFGIGDCLTNATYWLFPNSRVLNLYTLFGQPKPLLTWGAYARMDFVTLPLFAILPGLGSRVLYAIVSRSFQAGRTRVMKDGGDTTRKALEEELQRATAAQAAAAERFRAARRALQQAEGRAVVASEHARAAESHQVESARALDRANAATAEANAVARSAGARAEAARSEASRAGAAAEVQGRKCEAETRLAEQADAELRLASGRKTELEDALSDLQAHERVLAGDISSATAERDALAERSLRMRLAAETGQDADGRPLRGDEVQEARAEHLKASEALAAQNARLDDLLNEQAVTARRIEAKAKDVAAEEARCSELLDRHREASRRAEVAAREEEALREQGRRLDEVAAGETAEARSAHTRAAEAQRAAQDEARRQVAARAATERSVREANAAVAERNALAQAMDAARKEQVASEQKLRRLSEALGLPPPHHSGGAQSTPPPEPVGSGHRRPQPHASRAAEMDRVRREREARIRALQERNKGSLPSGLGGASAAFGAGAAQSIAGVGAAVAGAAIGGAIGGGLLSGHMWAEYFPLREWLHPSRTADPSCYRMDVGYLHTNILSGVSSAAGVGPVSVVVAEGGGGGSPPGVTPSAPPPERMSPEERAARDAAQKARDEADAIRKQWEDSEATGDKSDPGYDKLRKEYDDYIQSKEREAEQAEAEADGLRQQGEADEAAKAHKAQWIKTQQQDVERYEEEKAHLEAVIAGAAAAGFSVSDHERRLAEIDRNLRDIHGNLRKEGADVEHHAVSRGVISPGKEFVEARDQNERLKQQAREIESLGKLQQGALKHDLWNPGGPGDVVGAIEKLKQDVWSGKTPDPDQIGRIRDLIKGHMSGRLEKDGTQPPDFAGWFGGVTDGELWTEALAESGRNLSTGQTSSGEISWSGMAGRVGIGLLTAGKSEWVFMPMAGMYTVKDSVDRGESGLRAFGNAAAGAVIDYGIGKGLEGVFGVGAGAWKGGRAGAREAAEGWAKGVAQEGRDLVSGAGWKKTLGFGGAGGGAGTPPGDVLPASSRLTPAQQATAARAKAAAGSGDPATMRQTFQREGADALSEAQRAGGIDPATARRINDVVRSDVNQAVRQGTKESIEEFQSRTGVKVREVLVGDSGSSAKGPTSRLRTDADRTLVPTFDDDTLNKYAWKNNCSRSEAYDKLCGEFRDVHQSNVQSNLEKMGYAQGDIGYGSYDRIGGASGHADSYPNGFTSARQATQGTADVYKVSPDGNRVADPYRTSGQSLVDQNHLNQQRAGWQGPGQAPDQMDPTRIPRAEVPGIVDQQAHTATTSTDPEDLAKAVSRTSKAAAINGDVLPNPKVVEMAEHMRNNPGWSAGDVERRFGMSMQEFTRQAREQVTGYQQRIGGGR